LSVSARRVIFRTLVQVPVLVRFVFQILRVVVSLVTDEFVVFPWGARILVSGRWKPHPEVEAGIQAQHPHDRQG
jgi:hypothetical protein